MSPPRRIHSPPRPLRIRHPILGRDDRHAQERRGTSGVGVGWGSREVEEDSRWVSGFEIGRWCDERFLKLSEQVGIGCEGMRGGVMGVSGERLRTLN